MSSTSKQVSIDPGIREVLPYLERHLMQALSLRLKAEYDSAHFDRHGWRAASLGNQQKECARLMRLARQIWNAPELSAYLEATLPRVYAEGAEFFSDIAEVRALESKKSGAGLLSGDGSLRDWWSRPA
jgi:hypothetical protein